jgi:hypothetical protein
MQVVGGHQYATIAPDRQGDGFTLSGSGPGWFGDCRLDPSDRYVPIALDDAVDLGQNGVV